MHDRSVHNIVPNTRLMIDTCTRLFLLFPRKNIISKGYGGLSTIFWNFQREMKNPKGWFLYEIPSVVGVWIFCGTTQYNFDTIPWVGHGGACSTLVTCPGAWVGLELTKPLVLKELYTKYWPISTNNWNIEQSLTWTEFIMVKWLS